MPNTLLSTKFYTPPLRSDAISRPQLIEKLLSGADRPGVIGLISGPAGFGKSTLMSEFFQLFPRPIARVSLDPGDNEISRYWTYIITALQSISDDIGEGVLELLNNTQFIPKDTIPTILINDIVQSSKSFVLILDDYHEIQNNAIHASMEFFLDNLPENFYLIIATRIDPPWPLARYRARNRLIEIRVQDLRFNADETGEFLAKTMGLNLSAKDISALETRTEGWIAGLQLAALSLQGRDKISEYINGFSGSHVYIADYLVEEVLTSLPENTLTFLLKTSLLNDLNAELCEAVTGFQNSEKILQRLHKENVFIIPLDIEGKWFRYHQLFTDLLQNRLRHSYSEGQINSIHSLAADWLENHNYPNGSITHALAAKDFDRAAQMFMRSAPTLLNSGRITTVRNWLEAFPDDFVQTFPQLSFYHFWIDVLQSQADLSQDSTQKLENQLNSLPSTPENDRLRGELMAVVCRAITLSGRIPEGIRLAKEALSCLPEDSISARSRAMSALAAGYGLDGKLDQATSAYEESYDLAIAAGDLRLAANIGMIQGLVQIHYGKLHEADNTFQKIIAMTPQRSLQKTPSSNLDEKQDFLPAGQGYIGLGCVYLEWNDLETAEKLLKRGMDFCRKGGLDGLFIAKLRMSRLLLAKGDLPGALQQLKIPPQTQRVDKVNLTIRRIKIALALKNHEEISLLAEPLFRMLDQDRNDVRIPQLFYEEVQSTAARVLIASGEINRALEILDALRSTAEPANRVERMIEFYLLSAIALQSQNENSPTREAIENFEHALNLGEPEGYVLHFLEEGSAILPLMEAICRQDSTPERIKNFAEKLLFKLDQLTGHNAITNKGYSESLVEQLTDREMEVLALLAKGDSNKEIAEKLFITERTVKKHASNIYGKLNVSNRTQAVNKSRQIGILPKA